jgi:GABA(A) receptor-associated protein
MTFKNKYAFNDRKVESDRVLSKYPDRVPIICERSEFPSDKTCPFIDKNKYLVPKDMTLGQFLFVIRGRMKIPAEKALFLFVNNRILSSTRMIADIYKTEKDIDGFLYTTYSYENVFG